MPEIGEIRRGREIGYKQRDKRIWAACIDCGKERWVTLSKGEPKDKKCRRCANPSGENHPCWKGGRHRNEQGYIKVWLPLDDFFYSMCDKTNRVLEHRLIVAKALGRCLHSWEIVHHKNHIRDDNRIENLQLIQEMQHNQLTIMESKIDRLLEGQRKLKVEIKLLKLENKRLRGRLQ